MLRVTRVTRGKATDLRAKCVVCDNPTAILPYVSCAGMIAGDAYFALYDDKPIIVCTQETAQRAGFGDCVYINTNASRLPAALECALRPE